MQLDLFGTQERKTFRWKGVLFSADKKPIGIMSGQMESAEPNEVLTVIARNNPFVNVQEVWSE